MGFMYWTEGLKMIAFFLFVVGLPCVLIAILGSRMINDIGNHPSRNFQIQAATNWKVFLVVILSTLLLIGLYMFLFNLQNG